MSEIDFNVIYDAVTLALHRKFPTARIHSGFIHQGLNDGDFNIKPVTVVHTEQMGDRSKCKAVFDVIYYASRAGGRAECLKIADSLPSILGTIQTKSGDKLHCLSFDNTIEDDTLHCMAEYPYFTYKPQTEDAMENLIIG